MAPGLLKHMGSEEQGIVFVLPVYQVLKTFNLRQSTVGVTFYKIRQVSTLKDIALYAMLH